jgi:hypothetical protein
VLNALRDRKRGAALATDIDGIRYLGRHDPAHKLIGVALFGEPGARRACDRRWPRGTQEPIGDELIDDAGGLFGYRVLPAP